MKFEIGDVVRLKSGGPKMTVETVRRQYVTATYMYGGEVKQDVAVSKTAIEYASFWQRLMSRMEKSIAEVPEMA